MYNPGIEISRRFMDRSYALWLDPSDVCLRVRNFVAERQQ